MQLTDIEVQEFSDLWFSEFGERLSLEQARLQAALLMQFYARLTLPLPDAVASDGSGPARDEVLSVLPQVE